MNFFLWGVLCICQFIVSTQAELNETTSDEDGIPKIVGGTTVDIREHPYQVSLRRIDYNDQHYCGGAIVSERHILTAAHCLVEEKASRIKVVAGTSLSKKGSGDEYRIQNVRVHPKYNGDGIPVNDIALLTLSRAIKLGVTQNIVELPQKNIQELKREVIATITGWGDTIDGVSSTPLQLKKTTTKLISLEKCRADTSDNSLTNKHLCAYPHRETGMCQGDSGGPLVVNGTVIGIASAVYECSSKYPQLYTNVFSYVENIKSFIAKDKQSNPQPPIYDHPETNPEFKPESGPESKPELYPGLEPDFNPEFKPELGPESKPEFYPEFETDFNPELGPESKPEFYPGLEPDFNPEFKPELGPESKPEFYPGLEPDFKPEYGPEFESYFKPEYNPEFTPDFKPGNEPEFTPDFKPGYEPEFVPGYETEFTPDFKPEYESKFETEYNPDIFSSSSHF